MNYIVMECYPSFAVLLDEDGRFHKAANLRYCVGDTVTDPVLMHDTRPRRHSVSRWAYVAGILAACLTLVLGLLAYQSYALPVSSIALRINPEVQMDLNRHGRVVALRGLNADGKTLLADYHSRGKDSLTVSEELIDRAIESGYLSDGGEITFSVDTSDESRFDTYAAALRQGVADHLDGRMHVTVTVHAGHDLPPESETLPSDDDDDDDNDGDDDDDDDD